MLSTKEIPVNLPDSLPGIKAIIYANMTPIEFAKQLNAGIDDLPDMDEEESRPMHIVISTETTMLYMEAFVGCILSAKERAVTLANFVVKSLTSISSSRTTEDGYVEHQFPTNSGFGTLKVKNRDGKVDIDFFFTEENSHPVMGLMRNIEPEDVIARLISLAIFHSK